METLKDSDKFRQLLKKLSLAKPSANVQLNRDTNVRKSNREIKKPVQYDASPNVATAKGPKRKDKYVEHKKSAERRDKSGERGDRSGRRKDKSRERMTGEAPLVSRTILQDLRKESVTCGPSSPHRSAFTRVVANENERSSNLTRQTIQEPSQFQPSGRRVDNGSCEERTRRQQDHEGSYMPERRRQRDIESSYMPERRRQQEYETSYEPEKKLADMYSRDREVFAKPRPVSFNQSRWLPNASQNYGIHGTIRQPVVRLDDIARARGRSAMYRSRIDMPHPEMQQPTVRLFDVLKSKERAAWQHSRVTQPLPDHPKRYDGGFLRPRTPPGTAELARKEESTFLDALSKFTNYSLLSTVEVIFFLNHLEDSLIHKISKTIRKSDTAKSVLRMTMMETVPEDSSRGHMVQSWLRSNDSGAPSRLVDDTEVRSKRMREPTEYEYAKRMRVAADEDGVPYQAP